jgi:hypothetical protein
MATRTYFRQCDAGSDPHALLNPVEQVSTPWGSPDHGPCDKCEQAGSLLHHCLSCAEDGPDPECPACEGRVGWVAVCPTCAGTGEIADTKRAGVSVFPTLGGLYRYLVERDFDFGGSVIVELEGRLADEPDLDADSGAVLVHPSDIVTVHAVDEERIAALASRLDPR